MAAYLALLLLIDRSVSWHGQLLLGVATWALLAAILVRLPPVRRAQVVGVVLFATVGELTGSILWGVYTYRLHNLPLFIPPAHGLVYLTALSLAAALRGHTRLLVATAAAVALGWGVLGLTVLPAAMSPARSACRCCCSSSGARPTAPSTPASSSSSPPSSCTARRSGRGAGRRRCPGSASPTGTLPPGSPRATSGST